MLWKLSLKILTPYCQSCKKEDLLWETSTTHNQLPYSKIQSRYSTHPTAREHILFNQLEGCMMAKKDGHKQKWREDYHCIAECTCMAERLRAISR